MEGVEHPCCGYWGWFQRPRGVTCLAALGAVSVTSTGATKDRTVASTAVIPNCAGKRAMRSIPSRYDNTAHAGLQSVTSVPD